MRAASWITLLLLAGCLGAAPGPSAAGATVPTLALKGCENLGVALPAPLDEAQARLPPGFTAVASRPLPEPTAVMYVIGLRCADALVDGVPQGPTLLSYVELDVRPPTAERVAGVDDYVVPVSFTAPGAVGDALAAMCLGRAGAGSVSAESATPVDATFTVSQGGVTYTLRGATPQSAGTLTPEHFIVFGVQDAQLVTRFDGATTRASARTGPVALTASGDPLLEGAQPAASGFRVGVFDLTLTPR